MHIRAVIDDPLRVPREALEDAEPPLVTRWNQLDECVENR